MFCTAMIAGMKEEPIYLALPMGDPAGIGPEIILKMMSASTVPFVVALVIVGDASLFEKTAQDLYLPFGFDAIVEDEEALVEAKETGKRCILYDMHSVDLTSFSYGVINSMCGKASFDAVKLCVELVEKGLCKAVVTPPLHKEALNFAHIPHIGYTEILSELTGTKNAITMFDTLGLKIFFHTRHLSLLDACKAVTKESLLKTILSCDAITKSSKAFDMQLPLVVAGLNPHCGEHGLFGDEEQIAIEPAISEARRLGVEVVGPVGADSVFYQTRMGKYRAVISLYHDQGHIAAKTFDFNQTISITWNLPFLRTSVDHGTAFDIAGKGVADSQGMVRAVLVAAEYLAKGDRYQ